MFASMNGTPVLPAIQRAMGVSGPAAGSQEDHQPGVVRILACFGSVTSSKPPSVKSFVPNLRAISMK